MGSRRLRRHAPTSDRVLEGTVNRLVCGILCSVVLAPSWAAAEGADPSQPPPTKVEASLMHSVSKAITLKVATFTTGTIIYAFGTGSLAAGSALSAINTAGSFVMLTANDYAWDYFWPNTNVKANNDSFEALNSVSRNTAKYLTFKPMVTVLNIGSIYWWTGSVANTAVTGTAAVLILPMRFYVNNTLWDWYDWQRAATHGAK
jgi:uncharacterized membrane protein